MRRGGEGRRLASFERDRCTSNSCAGRGEGALPMTPRQLRQSTNKKRGCTNTRNLDAITIPSNRYFVPPIYVTARILPLMLLWLTHASVAPDCPIDRRRRHTRGATQLQRRLASASRVADGAGVGARRPSRPAQPPGCAPAQRFELCPPTPVLGWRWGWRVGGAPPPTVAFSHCGFAGSWAVRTVGRGVRVRARRHGRRTGRCAVDARARLFFP